MRLTPRQASTLVLELDREHYYERGQEQGYTRAQLDKQMLPERELSGKQKAAIRQDLYG